MNWYTTNKIDSFVLAYWTDNTIKTAGIKDWWKGVKDDFSDNPLMKGTWGVGKNALLAIMNALYGVISPIFSMIVGDKVWGTSGEFLKKAIQRIAKTIYSAAQMGYGGVKLLKDLASMIRKDLAQEISEAMQNDREENKPFNKLKEDASGDVGRAANEVAEEMAFKIDNFADQLAQQAA